jgi:hypothetical protein
MSIADRVAELWQSGELVRLAAKAKLRRDLAAAIGISDETYAKATQRLRGRGVMVPSFEELRGGEQRRKLATPDLASGPNLAAFDREIPVEAVPAGHVLRGVSTLVDPDGVIKQQWIKTSVQNDERQLWLDAIRTLADELPRAEPVPAPSYSNEDLLATYLIGDAHVGMYAWKDEAGENFDLEIAERNLVGAIQHLAALAPPAERGLVINIGDYFHSDNKGNTTTRGTPVDVDGRWPKVMAAGIRTMRRIIGHALDRHKHVTVINEIGNHDTHASLMLSIALAQFYEHESRITIDTSPEMFHWYRFRKVLIGTHHGHLVKPHDLIGVMASDRAKDWGETLYRYFFNGHVHHERVREYAGVIAEWLRSPASSDAWHRGQGYRSGHDLKLDVFHGEWGRINRHIVGIQQIRGSHG